MCSYVCIKCMAIFSVLKTKPNQKLFSYATFGPYTNSSTVGLQQCGETVNMFRQLVQFEAFLRKWKTIQKFLIQKYSHIMRNGQCVSMQKAFFSESYCLSQSMSVQTEQLRSRSSPLLVSLLCYVNLTYFTFLQ